MSQANKQPKQPKPRGTCGHCLRASKLHSGGTLVHLHGQRDTPCIGSNRPPLELGGGPTDQDLGLGGSDGPTQPGGTLRTSEGVIAAGGPGLAHPEQRGPLLKHICRGARPACAGGLGSALREICGNPGSAELWSALLSFAPTVLAQQPRSGRLRNMTTLIKKRVEGMTVGTKLHEDEPEPFTREKRKRNQEEVALAAISSKLEDGNIRAAVRILCEGGKMATPDEDNLVLLREKHPRDTNPEALEGLPDPSSTGAWQMTVEEVLEAVCTFPSGSAGGPDGFRPGHLLELVGSGDGALPLAEAVTDFVNLLLRGECPPTVRPILFGGNLIALNKDSGGLRPIAIDYLWRRLAAKCANRRAVARLSAHFTPVQLGIAVPGGCEAAVHATRRFIRSMRPDQVLVKLDFTNAFNSLRPDIMLSAVYKTIPEIYPFALQAFSAPSVLRFGHLLLTSEWVSSRGTHWVLCYSVCHSNQCCRL